MAYGTADIRNVAFVGHGAAGKTNLVEALLFAAGATNRQGKTQDKTSICDWGADEKDRGNTIDSAVVHATWKGKRLNLVDTPGYPDFLGEVVGAMSAVDAVVLAVDGSAGVRVNTRTTWSMARRRNLPTLIVVNRLDQDHAKFFDHLEFMQENLDRNCVPLNVPNAEGPSFSKVESTFSLDDSSSDKARAINEKLIEGIVEQDEELMARYLEGETIGADELRKAFLAAFLSGSIFPVMVTSTEKNLGATELLDAIVDLFPSPADVVHRAQKGKGDAAEPVEVKIDGPFSGIVFKSVTDAFVGRLSYCRVISGTMKPNTVVKNLNSGESCKIGHVLEVQGKDQKPIDQGVAGDIVAFAKVENVHIGDTVAVEGFPGVYPKPAYPEPMVSLAVFPKSRADEQKISGSLTKLADEDITFRVRRDKDTAEQVVSGLSDLHLKIKLDRLKARFDVEVETHLPRIPYRETISSKGDARYRHKKQTGGAGQFAEVWMRVEPNERGAGVEFESKVVGGVISQSFIPSIEKGMRAVCASGVIAGCLVVDVKAIVYDGKEHPVDSKDIAFQVAGRGAFKEAFMAAKPILLEPVMVAEITVPNDNMGDIMGDLNGRRGRIVNTETAGAFTTIKATVPLAEVQSYSTELRSITGGEGHFTLVFSHYDMMPPNIQQDIVAKAKLAKEEE